MYLRTLKLKDFAGLGAVDLEGFEPGLNVIVGDNEAGKSTLLLALRAAFFQKHRATGEAAKALAPYGRAARPEIAVGFDTGGSSYELRKSFLQRPEAELSWPGGALSSDAVEERLAEILGFAHPGRGESKLGEHQGAFGLLWVEQGRSHEHDLNLGVGKNAVTASLEGEIGQILGGDRGRALLGAAKALQDRFFTATLRTAAGSPLGKVDEELAALRAALAEKQALRRDYEEKIDRLRSRRTALNAYIAEDTAGAAERAVEAAEQRARAVAGYEEALAAAARDLEHADTRRAAVGERLAARLDLDRRAELGETAQREAAAMLEDVRQSQAGDLAELERLDAARTAARTEYAAAEAADEAATGRAEQQRLAGEILALEARLKESGTVEQRLAALRAATVAGTQLDRKALQALEQAERSRREAEILVTAAAPTIRFSPQPGRTVTAPDGRAVPGDSALPILASTVFDLDGFGRITVEPGGDASELRRVFEAAEAGLNALLTRHGVADVAAARRRLQETEDRASEMALLAKQRQAILPEGVAAATEALTAARSALAALPPETRTAAEPAADAAQLARARRRRAQADLATADAALESARTAASGVGARLAKAEAELEHRLQTARRLAAERTEAEQARPTAALRADLAAAELDRAAKAAVVALRRRDLDEADPETAARTLIAKRRALEEIRRTVAGLKDETAALDGELRAQGLTSLGEDIDRLTGDIAMLEGRRQRLALEAEAVRLLYETLTTAQREAREHWLGPIKAQVAPYLRLIHPDSEVAFDDSTLAITGLHRRGVEEDFKRLSAGAREQVAVVTRLALAIVLKRGGHPALVILDDALVNTDEQRLERMHLVLQKAAEAMQIIILTCRERDFRGLGGKLFRL